MAKFTVNPTSEKILDYVKNHCDENITAVDIAQALEMKVKSVDGILTTSLRKRGPERDTDYIIRVPAVMELEDGSVKNIKLIKLTEEGSEYTHESAVQKDNEIATATEEE